MFKVIYEDEKVIIEKCVYGGYSIYVKRDGKKFGEPLNFELINDKIRAYKVRTFWGA